MTPQSLVPYANRTVRSVMQSRDDAAINALCDIAATAKKRWTLTEWSSLLASLDTTNIKVGDFIARR